MVDTTQSRVLVVDDEQFFREAIREILERAGHEIVLAEDGERGLELAGDPTIAVVVLDIRLPGIDGLEVLRRLRDLQPLVRVIMLSASTDQELVLEALRLGACDYLAKPLHDEELALAVGRAAESHGVASGWGRLRGRLDRLVAQMEELTTRVASTSEDERDAVLRHTAAAAAAEVLEAAKASLMLVTEDGERLEVAAVVGQNLAPEQMDPVAVGEGIAGLAFERAEPFVVEDIDRDDRMKSTAPEGRYASGSFAVAPLEAGSRRLGVLCVADRADGGAFGQDDLALLRLLALHLSELMALDRAMKEKLDPALVRDFVSDEVAPAEVLAVEPEDGSSQLRDAELARLVCDAAVSEVEPDRVLRAILQPVASELSAGPASLYLIDNATGELVREGEARGGFAEDRDGLPRQRGLTGSVLQTGVLVAAAHPEADPRFDPEVDTPADGEVAPYLCVPLSLRGKVVGLFRAFLRGGDEPSARTGEVLAAALSSAVRNVLLYRSLVETIEEVAEARRESQS